MTDECMQKEDATTSATARPWPRADRPGSIGCGRHNCCWHISPDISRTASPRFLPKDGVYLGPL